MNYWIFTVNDEKVGAAEMKGVDIYRQRMTDSFWGLGIRTANRRYLSENDQVVFYLAGSRARGQVFLGTCVLDSPYYEVPDGEKKRLRHGPFFQATHGVRLRDIQIWESWKPIHPLIGELKFIKRPEVWGSYLQGSIKSISSEDYVTIAKIDKAELQALQEIEEQSVKKSPRLTEKRRLIKSKRRARDNAFHREVRELYDSSCAICGKRRVTRLGHPEVDSAHIFPKERDGSDDLRDGIALCKLHHWALDGGLFTIRDDHSVVVESRILGDANYEEIARFHSRKIRPPKIAKFKPHPIFLAEHRKIHGF